MRPLTLFVLVAATGAAFAQPLSCPPGSNLSGHPCEAFHFHVQMYRPDTKGFFEAYGTNQFASQSACDRAREAQMSRNLAVVDHMKRVGNEQQYQPDRFGTCHCDMTIEKTSPNFLTDLQRLAQIRTTEEIRGRVRERLLAENATTDSEVIRGLSATPTANALLGGPRLVPLPGAQVLAVTANAPEELKLTTAVASSSMPSASIELPLVDVVSIAEAPTTATAIAPATMPVTTPAASPSVAATEAVPAPAPATPAPAPATPAAAPATPAAAPTTPSAAPATPVTAPTTPSAAPAATDAVSKPDDNVATAEEAADAFISYETQRIQNVLRASSAINDEGMKSKILESCMQRIQLLSNLRTLIQGSGARSRLATAARKARVEPERLALVTRLFGSDMPPHWAPKDASDVILPSTPEIDADAEKVLRDSSGKFSDQQRKHALYVLLAHSQPTEEQQLWLSTVVDTFLQ